MSWLGAIAGSTGVVGVVPKPMGPAVVFTPGVGGGVITVGVGGCIGVITRSLGSGGITLPFPEIVGCLHGNNEVGERLFGSRPSFKAFEVILKLVGVADVGDGAAESSAIRDGISGGRKLLSGFDLCP